MGFQYNGKLRAPEVLLREGGGTSLIRDRESLSDLFGNTKMPSDLAKGLPTSYPYIGRGKSSFPTLSPSILAAAGASSILIAACAYLWVNKNK